MSDHIPIVMELGEVMTVSQEELENQTNLKVFPNPSTGILHVNQKGFNNFQIIDANAKILREFVVETEQLELDLSDLANGIYFLKGLAADQISIQKIILQ